MSTTELAFRTYVDPFPPPKADFDFDGDVNGDDFLIWQANFGLADPWGRPVIEYCDADRDGDIDGNDFLIWQSEVDTSSNSASIAVPEPATLVLVAFSLLAGLARIFEQRGAALR